MAMGSAGTALGAGGFSLQSGVDGFAEISFISFEIGKFMKICGEDT